MYGLDDGEGLVITVAEYVTPKGTRIQKNGVPIDFEKGSWNDVEEVLKVCRASYR